MRSCGRDGPAKQGSIADKSISITCAYTRFASPVSLASAASAHVPWRFAYASTKRICSTLRPVIRRYSSVCSSTGKSVHVEPYSGVILEMHARCVALKLATPSPKHSTKHPTTFSARRTCANFNATSMPDTPADRRPTSFTPTTRGTSVVIGCPRAAASASIPPTPQPKTPMPFAVGVWLSVPTNVSKYTESGPLAALAAPAASATTSTTAPSAALSAAAHVSPSARRFHASVMATCAKFSMFN